MQEMRSEGKRYVKYVIEGECAQKLRINKWYLRLQMMILAELLLWLNILISSSIQNSFIVTWALRP